LLGSRGHIAVASVIPGVVGSDRYTNRRSPPSTEGYGSGGLLHGKRHMLSLTWNAPIEAFIRPGDFFDGAGVDAVYLHFHKANEFLGIKPLPTFICNDVVKNPQVERFLADYRAHLQRVFPA